MISETGNGQIKILEKILHGIMITDMQGLVIYSNPANAKIFGYSISDIKGMSIRTLYDEKDDMNIASLMNQVMDSNPVRMRWHGVQKNSERVWLEIRANRLPGENNEPDSCVISLHKIDYVKSNLNNS